MRKHKLALIIGSLLVLCIVAYIGWDFVQSHPDRFYASQVLNNRSTSSSVATAFTLALRLNNETLYEIAEPSLWPRLDEWIKTHQVLECKELGYDGSMSAYGIVENEGVENYRVSFACYLHDNSYYTFDVYDIKVQDGSSVIDWGEIIEKVE